MNIIKEAVDKTTLEVDKLGKFFNLKQAQGKPITEEDLIELGAIQGEIINQAQNLLLVAGTIDKARDSVWSFFQKLGVD